MLLLERLPLSMAFIWQPVQNVDARLQRLKILLLSADFKPA
jgi:hypothetical protein